MSVHARLIFGRRKQALASLVVSELIARRRHAALGAKGWELTCCRLARQGRVMALLRATALALALGSANAGGAYPDLSNGAQYVKLTDSTFDSFIGDALAAGKTAMVRWIASEG